MIEIKGLTIDFSGNKVIDNMTIDFVSNKIHGIVGFNGAGKTTFFNAMASNFKVDIDRILFKGNKIKNKDIAHLETVNYFYSGITGMEYLNIFKSTNPDFNLELLQSLFKLPLDDLIESYSTGMKKKLALLGILKKDNPILLLDEPFNGLDLETNKVLELIILKLKEKGKTIFLSSHILDPLLVICDEIHIMENGIFSTSYHKEDFLKIEEKLFAKLKSEAGLIINQSV